MKSTIVGICFLLMSASGCCSLCTLPSMDFPAPPDRCCDECGLLPDQLMARACDNRFSRAIDRHKAAKNAAPWPRFHPVPTYPVFYPNSQTDSVVEPTQSLLQPTQLGGFDSAHR
jgi:hypothetical protein